MDPCVGVLAHKATRVVAVRDGDVDRGGDPVGEAGEVQRAPVRQHAFAPSVGYGGELVVEHLGRAVHAAGEPVYGPRLESVRDRAWQKARFRDLRRARDAARLFYEFGYLLASAYNPPF